MLVLSSAELSHWDIGRAHWLGHAPYYGENICITSSAWPDLDNKQYSGLVDHLILVMVMVVVVMGWQNDAIIIV